MADFLTAVSTKKAASKPATPKIQDLSIQDATTIDTPQAALQALRDQPSLETVKNVLEFLDSRGVSLVIVEPVYASIAHELVSNLIPNFWKVLEQRKRDRQRLTVILRNPTGIGHLLTRLRTLLMDSRQQKAAGANKNVRDCIKDTLEVLDGVLSGSDVTYQIYESVLHFGKNDIQKRLMWKEYLAQVASGRALSIRAEAEDILKEGGIEMSPSGGNDLAEWLGQNIDFMLTAGDEDKDLNTALEELASKVLTLGYTGESSLVHCNLIIDNHARSSGRCHPRQLYRVEPSGSIRSFSRPFESIRTAKILQRYHRLCHQAILSLGDCQQR
jgi:telomere length regulation protein